MRLRGALVVICIAVIMSWCVVGLSAAVMDAFPVDDYTADESADEPVDESAEGPADETADELTDELADEPSDESVEEPVEEPADESVEELVEGLLLSGESVEVTDDVETDITYEIAIVFASGLVIGVLLIIAFSAGFKGVE